MTEQATDVLELRGEPYDGRGGGALVPLVQAEYVNRYGGPDATPVEAAEFLPPRGAFLVGYVDGEPVACGALRELEPGIAEIKRMYVAPPARRRGFARRLLDALEDTARAAGYAEVRLETGVKQPEAMALYQSTGYAAIPPYGTYRCAPGSRCFAKRLR